MHMSNNKEATTEAVGDRGTTKVELSRPSRATATEGSSRWSRSPGASAPTTMWWATMSGGGLKTRALVSVPGLSCRLHFCSCSRLGNMESLPRLVLTSAQDSLPECSGPVWPGVPRDVQARSEKQEPDNYIIITTRSRTLAIHSNIVMTPHSQLHRVQSVKQREIIGLRNHK